MEFFWLEQRPHMQFYKDQKMSPLKGLPLTPYTSYNYNNN
jgi:hypothetical protein